jgi:ribosome-associated heat shock protein Hsp15
MARIDKWLWAARFFKTRSIAQQAIEGGKVRLNGERTKPARDLKVGDTLDIQIGSYEWSVRVLQLSDKRGPATVARTLYEESEESRARRANEAAKRRLTVEPALSRKGRPTKRDRRDLERWSESD